jgi:hypothetical protein
MGCARYVVQLFCFSVAKMDDLHSRFQFDASPSIWCTSQLLFEQGQCCELPCLCYEHRHWLSMDIGCWLYDKYLVWQYKTA